MACFLFKVKTWRRGLLIAAPVMSFSVFAQSGSDSMILVKSLRNALQQNSSLSADDKKKFEDTLNQISAQGSTAQSYKMLIDVAGQIQKSSANLKVEDLAKQLTSTPDRAKIWSRLKAQLEKNKIIIPDDASPDLVAKLNAIVTDIAERGSADPADEASLALALKAANPDVDPKLVDAGVDSSIKEVEVAQGSTDGGSGRGGSGGGSSGGGGGGGALAGGAQKSAAGGGGSGGGGSSGVGGGGGSGSGSTQLASNDASGTPVTINPADTYTGIQPKLLPENPDNPGTFQETPAPDVTSSSDVSGAIAGGSGGGGGGSDSSGGGGGSGGAGDSAPSHDSGGGTPNVATNPGDGSGGGGGGGGSGGPSSRAQNQAMSPTGGSGLGGAGVPLVGGGASKPASAASTPATVVSSAKPAVAPQANNQSAAGSPPSLNDYLSAERDKDFYQNQLGNYQGLKLNPQNPAYQNALDNIKRTNQILSRATPALRNQASDYKTKHYYKGGDEKNSCASTVKCPIIDGLETRSNKLPPESTQQAQSIFAELLGRAHSLDLSVGAAGGNEQTPSEELMAQLNQSVATPQALTCPAVYEDLHQYGISKPDMKQQAFKNISADPKSTGDAPTKITFLEAATNIIGACGIINCSKNNKNIQTSVEWQTCYQAKTQAFINDTTCKETNGTLSSKDPILACRKDSVGTLALLLKTALAKTLAWCPTNKSDIATNSFQSKFQKSSLDPVTTLLGYKSQEDLLKAIYRSEGMPTSTLKFNARAGDNVCSSMRALNEYITSTIARKNAQEMPSSHTDQQNGADHNISN